ncbi:MAG: hypothetical protein Q4C70_14780, partial [Planctomycetia bacterium]|nr:hypothetical protein [Planctomycetia bacterium]
MSNENLPENIDNIPTAEVEELIEAPTPTTENASAPSVPTEDKLATEEIPQPSPISTPPSNRENLDEEDTDNFLPTETHTWYYSLRDLVDEIFWGVIFMAVWIGLFFHYPTSPSGLMFYNILTVLFLVSIIYFSVLHNPLKIFLRNNDPKNPRPHRVGKETLAFALLLLGVAVFLYRLPANFAKQVTPPETATQEVMETAEITETIQTVPPT